MAVISSDEPPENQKRNKTKCKILWQLRLIAHAVQLQSLVCPSPSEGCWEGPCAGEACFPLSINISGLADVCSQLFAPFSCQPSPHEEYTAKLRTWPQALQNHLQVPASYLEQAIRNSRKHL